MHQLDALGSRLQGPVESSFFFPIYASYIGTKLLGSLAMMVVPRALLKAKVGRHAEGEKLKMCYVTIQLSEILLVLV